MTAQKRPVRLLVAVATFHRNDDLAVLVPQLTAQIDELARVDPQLGAGVLVVDNDPAGGAAPIVQRALGPGLRYVVEQRPGIAAARNRALTEAGDADLLVFIDDDERPEEGWLTRLVGNLAGQRIGSSRWTRSFSIGL